MPDGHAQRPSIQDVVPRICAGHRATAQPPLAELAPLHVTAAVASLALGGAERIVLDWAAACARRHRVQVIVLRDAGAEWPVPANIELVRLSGVDVIALLERLGREVSARGNPTVLCHLLVERERAALRRGGARAIPVLHNAASGWIEPAHAFADCDYVISVSRAAMNEARNLGVRAPCAVVHHYCRAPRYRPEARAQWRSRWALPASAFVIGMIGGVKPQKAYPRALRVLAAVLQRRDAYLVIVGGPVGRDGSIAWQALLAQAQRLGIERYVRLPGFVPHAADCLPAFDVVLNTSRYEGLSLATLEALAGGLPVLASDVGGQREIVAEALTLVPFDAPDAHWVQALETCVARPAAPPPWIGFPGERMWTLFHAARPIAHPAGVLFVTANLNVGGAQRSLVNLACALCDSTRLEIAVCGESSAHAFQRALSAEGVRVFRTATGRDCFDHAEAIVRHVCTRGFAIVCFWNVDPKVKLLVTKVLGVSAVRLIDVSPGGYAFEEMHAVRAFQSCIAFSEADYYARLDRLVLKYRGDAPQAARRVSVIANGVATKPDTAAMHAPGAPPRVVVSGRIAPSKFLLEIVAAMRLLWNAHPEVELHVFGSAEPRHAHYARVLVQALDENIGRRVFLHGAVEDAPSRIAGFTAAVVLGEHQGCPNAVLEALAVGVPVVANDSGGTRELVIDGRTGLLLPTREPAAIASALARLIERPALARKLGRAGARHVARRFSMARMARAYTKLFKSLARGTHASLTHSRSG